MSLELPTSVFNVVPKTGSGWTRNVLYALGAKLIPGHVHVRKIVEGKLAFSFIRNPLDWYVSRWRCIYHRKRYTGELGPPDHINYVEDAQNQEEFEHFNVWLKRILYIDPDPGYRPTKDYGEVGFATKQFMHFIEVADFVGKYEQLETDLKRALDFVGQPYSPQAFSTPKVHIAQVEKPFYTKEMFDEVVRLDHMIFEKFDYTPDPRWLPIRLL